MTHGLPCLTIACRLQVLAPWGPSSLCLRMVAAAALQGCTLAWAPHLAAGVAVGTQSTSPLGKAAILDCYNACHACNVLGGAFSHYLHMNEIQLPRSRRICSLQCKLEADHVHSRQVRCGWLLQGQAELSRDVISTWQDAAVSGPGCTLQHTLCAGLWRPLTCAVSSVSVHSSACTQE